MSAKALVRVLAVTAIAGLSLLAAAGSAVARTVPVYTYSGQYYDGTGSTAGTLAFPSDVDMNQTAEKGYVTDPVRLGGSVSQFDGDGGPLGFSALGGETAIALHGESAQHVAVDNSTTSTKGNVYVLTEKVVKGYRPDGTELGGGFPLGGFQRVCDIATDAEGDLWVVDYPRYKLTEYDSNGVLTGKTIPFKPFTTGLFNGFCSLTFDSHDNAYFLTQGYGEIPTDYGKKYDSEGHVLSDFAGSAVTTVSATADMTTDHVFTLESKPFEGGSAPVVIEYDENGEAITSFGAPDLSFPGFESPTAVAVSAGDQRVYVADQREYEGARRIHIFERTGQEVVPTVKTEPPGLTTTSATLHGTIDLDGVTETTECYFQWGEYGNYGQEAPCTPGSPITTPGVHQVTAQLEGLTKGSQYHYRLVVKNSDNDILAFGRDRPFRPQGEISMSETVVSDVNSDGARISADVNPEGGETKYFVEYGQEDCDLSTCAVAPVEETFLPKMLGAQRASVVLTGLKSDTSYHYRLVAKNDFGEVASAEDVFRTYLVESTADTCPNALIRKETGTVLLPDCRAYELVSPANVGGYDVRSDLIPGQVPFTAKPRAADRVLYTLNFGKVPGVSGEPTNHGADPYIARRTGNGWTTTYAGIAVGDPPFQGPFASTPLEESEDLSSLLFGGPEICSPCFADGKTGLPYRRNEGPLTQGMAGALDPGPSAQPDGYIGRRLSADGKHLIFGSAAAFDPDAATNGDVSIYDRNLVTGVTHVVSKDTGGAPLTCLQGAGNCHGPGDSDGIASLDVSADGSRIVVAQRVSTDAAGNRLWHPYMNIGDSPTTVDLAPGTTSGVLYDGMSSDGSSVFFTTVDPLTSDDHDDSADVYRADVSASGPPALTRVSTGSGGGDTDSCNPAPAPGRNHWNAVGTSSDASCAAVAFAGGAGVARGSGAIYFLSPERLDGASGVQNQPNLYLSTPNDPAARFVATLEPSNPAIDHAVLDSDRGGFGDFQVTPSGNFAAFSSGLALTGFPTAGHTAIYRYAAQADSLICASCPTTRATLNADTELSEYGLNLADDGRVLFTSTEPLALRDSGVSSDVYERKNDRLYLISTGRSPTATGLLSVSADGTNAYFYTRDTLVSEDHNGRTVKIYTARENGGFASPPVIQPCQASDECHGPGSAAPPAAALPTFQGTGGNAKPVHKKKKRKHRHRRGHRHKHRHHHKSQRRAR